MCLDEKNWGAGAGKTKRSLRWSPGNQAEAMGRGEVSARDREGMIRK